MYFACQSQDGNLDEFFYHENQACTPSLSLHGKLKAGKQIRPLALPEDCGAVRKALTENIFDEYALNVFLPYTVSLLSCNESIEKTLSGTSTMKTARNHIPEANVGRG